MCSDKWQDEGSRNDYSKQKLAKSPNNQALTSEELIPVSLVVREHLHAHVLT